MSSVKKAKGLFRKRPEGTESYDYWKALKFIGTIIKWAFILWLIFWVVPGMVGCAKNVWYRVTYSPPPPPPPLTEREAQKVKDDFLFRFHTTNAAEHGWEATPKHYSKAYIAPSDEGPAIPVGMNLDGLAGCLLRYKNRKAAGRWPRCKLMVGPVESMPTDMVSLNMEEGSLYVPSGWSDIQIKGMQKEGAGCSTPGDEWPVDLWIDDGPTRAGGSKLPIRFISTYKIAMGGERVIWGHLPDPAEYDFDVRVIFREADGSMIDPAQRAQVRGGFWVDYEKNPPVEEPMATDYGAIASHRLPKGEMGTLYIHPPKLNIPVRVYVTLIAK